MPSLRTIRCQVADKMPAARQRAFRTHIDEVALSGLVSVILLIAVVWSIPDSAVQDEVQPVLTPVARAAGLGQSWRMFAPKPPEVNRDVDVQVTTKDGEIRVWAFQPDRSPLGSFNWDRWRKFEEQLIRNKNLRPAFAQWVVRELTEPSEHPIRVQIVMYAKPIPPPGTSVSLQTRKRVLYSKKLAGGQ